MRVEKRKRASRGKYQTFFMSNPLPMQRNLVKKQVMKAQSNKHRKAKQVQLQNFQHKERRLNIIVMYESMSPSLIITSGS